MPKRSRKQLDTMIVVALIGLAGTVIAALLASPVLERWLAPDPPAERDNGSIASKPSHVFHENSGKSDRHQSNGERNPVF